MVSLSLVAHEAKIPPVCERREVEALGDVTPCRPAPGELPVQLAGVCRRRRLGMARHALARRFVMLDVAVGAALPHPQLGASRMALGAPEIEVQVMIESDLSCSRLGDGQLERHGRLQRRRCEVTRYVTAIALGEAHLNVVAIGAPFPVRRRRRPTGPMTFSARERGVLTMLEAARPCGSCLRVAVRRHPDHQQKGQRHSSANHGDDGTTGTGSAYPR